MEDYACGSHVVRPQTPKPHMSATMWRHLRPFSTTSIISVSNDYRTRDINVDLHLLLFPQILTFF